MWRVISLALAVASATAGAAPRRMSVPVAPPVVVPASGPSRVILLERCSGGCAVRGRAGENDARTLTSSIVKAGDYQLAEFTDRLGRTGAAADAEWQEIVQCVREVYSPYDVEVTDVRPASGTYHAAIVAGRPEQVGYSPDVLGVAPLAGDCRVVDNAVSFTFANIHTQSQSIDRVLNVCWTAAQESAHVFGLDHQFEFVAGARSACTDPMTYRLDCGGQKFYRNALARCGEDSVRPCACGALQNSHHKLLDVFGAGTPIYGTPTVELRTPSPGATELPETVVAAAAGPRGVARVALFLNGFPYIEVPGAEFGIDGQGEVSYGLQVPGDVPDGVTEVVVRAYDDLGASTDSAAVTVTRGAPCTADAQCLAEQHCVAGGCRFDPPVGELGDACTFAAFCKSFQCDGPGADTICTERCEVGDALACPSGFSCQDGACYFDDSGGCCSTGGGGAAQCGALVFAVAIALRRRDKTRQLTRGRAA